MTQSGGDRELIVGKVSGCSSYIRLPSGLRLSRSFSTPGVLTWHDVKERIGDVVEKGDLQELKLYCDMLPTDRRAFSIDSLVNRDDETCLHISVRQGHVQCVEYLLDRGAGVNVAGRRGLTAIHLAAIKGDLHILDLLVKVGLIKTNTDTCLMLAG